MIIQEAAIQQIKHHDWSAINKWGIRVMQSQNRDLWFTLPPPSCYMAFFSDPYSRFEIFNFLSHYIFKPGTHFGQHTWFTEIIFWSVCCMFVFLHGRRGASLAPLGFILQHFYHKMLGYFEIVKAQQCQCSNRRQQLEIHFYGKNL